MADLNGIPVQPGQGRPPDAVAVEDDLRRAAAGLEAVGADTAERGDDRLGVVVDAQIEAYGRDGVGGDRRLVDTHAKHEHPAGSRGRALRCGIALGAQP